MSDVRKGDCVVNMSNELNGTVLLWIDCSSRARCNTSH